MTRNSATGRSWPAKILHWVGALMVPLFPWLVDDAPDAAPGAAR